MHKALMLAAALVAVGGCKKDSKSTGSASAADCTNAITGVFQREERSGMEGRAAVAKDIEAHFQPLSDAIAGACISDHWSPAMLACVRQAKDLESVDACTTFLDEAQRKHLDAVADAVEAKANAVPAASPTCAKFADLEIKCSGRGEDERSTILDFCAKAQAGKKELQLIALECTCADTATDCTSYKSCVEQKKHETQPTP
jgi:hypothetical protein